jgi:replicative DNA helicase
MSDTLLEVRGLPTNEDAERCVLGAILRDDSAYPMVSAALNTEDFSLERHKRIWLTMGELFEAGMRIERVTVYTSMREKGQTNHDLLSYLASLDDGLSDVFGVDTFIRQVKEKSILRRTIERCRKLENECLLHGDSVEVITQAEAAFRDLIVEAQPHGKLRTIPEIITASGGINTFLKPHERPRIYFPWGKANWMLGGLYSNELIVLAARPGVGKTAMAMQIGEHAAQKTGLTVAVFSMEMSGEQLLHRMACANAGVDSNRFRQGYLTDGERNEVYQALNNLHRLPIRIDDTPRQTVPALHATLRRLASREKIGLVIVDYLQLMESAGKASTRTEAVSQISRGLKIATGEFGVPFLVMSQLNRAPATEGRRPTLSDLRESGSIEQDANTVIMLHEPDKRPDDPSQPVTTELLVEKQRNGPVGMIPLMFVPQSVRFFEGTEERHDG